MDKSLHIYLRFVIGKREYECMVNESGNFHDLLAVMAQMAGHEFADCYRIGEGTLIMESVSKAICDQDVSFELLGVKNGMTFLIV